MSDRSWRQVIGRALVVPKAVERMLVDRVAFLDVDRARELLGQPDEALDRRSAASLVASSSLAWPEVELDRDLPEGRSPTGRAVSATDRTVGTARGRARRPDLGPGTVQHLGELLDD